MSFAVTTNLITIMLCLAVLVQSVRMMRGLDGMKTGQLSELVDALDQATNKARGVLSELKRELSTEGVANIRALEEGKEIRDELNLIVGIANAMAERLVEAAAPVGKAPIKDAASAAPESVKVDKNKATAKPKPASKTASQGRGSAVKSKARATRKAAKPAKSKSVSSEPPRTSAELEGAVA